jgi:glycosyltransferase involved in cell wall biosynthesis
VRPYLAHAALAVAPLQAPHGLQNKVLEAMAMQQLVLATPAALAGLDVAPGAEVLEVAEPGQFAHAVRTALRGNLRLQLGKAARARILRDYNWQARLGALDALLAVPSPQLALVR